MTNKNKKGDSFLSKFNFDSIKKLDGVKLSKQFSKYSLVLAISIITLVSSILAGVNLTNTRDTAQAGANYNCPPGTTLSGTSCIATVCPDGTAPVGGNCSIAQSALFECPMVSFSQATWLNQNTLTLNTLPDDQLPRYSRDIAGRVIQEPLPANMIQVYPTNSSGATCTFANVDTFRPGICPPDYFTNGMGYNNGSSIGEIYNNYYDAFNVGVNDDNFQNNSMVCYRGIKDSNGQLTGWITNDKVRICPAGYGAFFTAELTMYGITGFGTNPNTSPQMYKNRMKKYAICKKYNVPSILSMGYAFPSPAAGCAEKGKAQVGAFDWNLDAAGLAQWCGPASGSAPASVVGTTTSTPATLSSYTVDPASLANNSQSCGSTAPFLSPTLNVTGGDKGRCVFPLTGSPTNNYVLPSGGVTANIDSATGSSDACVVDNNYQLNFYRKLETDQTSTVNKTLTIPYSAYGTYNDNQRGGNGSVPVKEGWVMDAVTDMNGDSKPDMIWRYYDPVGGTNGSIVIWYMDKEKILESAVLTNKVADKNWHILGVADIDNDGKKDFVWGNYAANVTVIWYMDGLTVKSTGTVRINETDPTPVNSLADEWRLQGVADMNGDGKAELIFREISGLGRIVYWTLAHSDLTATTRKIWVGNIVLLPATNNIADQQWQIQAVGDISGDNKADIIWVSNTINATGSSVVVWNMDNTSRIGSKVMETFATGNLEPWRIAGLGDMDNDNKKDLVYKYYGAGSSYLVCPNIPTTNGTDGTKAVNLNVGGVAVPNKGSVVLSSSSKITTSDVTNMNFVCGNGGSVNANSTTTCTGTAPDGKVLDTANPLTLAIGNATTTSQACTQAGTIVTCTGVPTGTATGLQPVYATVGSGTKTDTTNKVTVNAQTTPITTSDIPSLNFNCGNVTSSPVVNSTTTCTATAPAGKTLDSANPLVISIGDSTGFSDACTQTNTTITCTSVPTGSQTGLQPIFGKVGNGTKTDTTDKVLVTGPVTQDNINNGFIDPNNPTGPKIPFNTATNLTCSDSTVGGTTTCTGTLPSGYTPPVDGLKLNVTGQTSVACTFASQLAGSNFTCNNLPVGNTIGNNIPVQGATGTNTPANTGETINVTASTNNTTDIILIDLANLTSSPARATPKEFCGGDVNNTRCSDLTIGISGDTRIQSGATCTFSYRAYPNSSNPNDNFVTTGLPNNGVVTYTNNSASILFDKAKQILPKYEFRVRCTNPATGTNAGKTYGLDTAYFFLYGAIGVVNISGGAI
jgi:FG-GAP-like repeat